MTIRFWLVRDWTSSLKRNHGLWNTKHTQFWSNTNYGENLTPFVYKPYFWIMCFGLNFKQTKKQCLTHTCSQLGTTNSMSIAFIQFFEHMMHNARLHPICKRHTIQWTNVHKWTNTQHMIIAMSQFCQTHLLGQLK